MCNRLRICVNLLRAYVDDDVRLKEDPVGTVHVATDYVGWLVQRDSHRRGGYMEEIRTNGDAG